jgi:5-methylcytosine-specific restriction endonuclease McrA
MKMANKKKKQLIAKDKVKNFEVSSKLRTHRRELAIAKQFIKQNGLCFWCARPMKVKSETRIKDPLRVSREHVIPKSKGGSNRKSNITLSHMRCNILRGTADQKPKIWDKINSSKGEIK